MGSISPAPLYKDFDVEDVLSELSMDEKISLISGRDPWHTTSIPRLGVPSIRCTDGPNGVRGTRFFNGVASACLPCGTALAATWNTNLIRQGGILQGHEAIAKGASIILGPTCNIQRSPLGGRGFESFSEDPTLSGLIAAATIRGIQSTGVAATLKHFVCNDQEHERQSVDIRVSERALREIYLMPFQIAKRDVQPMLYMTSYNRVNGIHVSEDKRLIQGVLRDEWGFDGLVVSDWFGVYSTTESILAGLDLEMPGPSYIRGSQARHALGCGKLQKRDIDDRVRAVLKLVKKLLPLNIEEDAPELKSDTPATAATLRTLASESIVLLKNNGNVLPFNPNKSIAVIGPNADIAAYCGGGSASLVPYYAVSPLEGIKNQMKSSTIKYELGAPGWKKLPLLSRASTALDGKPGLTMTTYLDTPSDQTKRRRVESLHTDTSDIFLADYSHPSIQTNLFYLDLEGTIHPDETAEYEFSLSVSGTANLYVNNTLIIDNTTSQTPGDSFFGSGTIEATGRMTLTKDETYSIHITFGSLPTSTYTVDGATAFGSGGLRVGFTRKIDISQSIARAVATARTVDQVLLCVGLNADWESEGYDRTTMSLPTGSDDLIRAVLAANPNTAVVVQSGTPVDMSAWLPAAPAVVHAWYGGNETGNAIADVVFGRINPSGKLPLSFPLRMEDNPAFLNTRAEGGRIVYGEDVYVGYRFYEKMGREVAFPFGHGLSYTAFEIAALRVETEERVGCYDEATLMLCVNVTNTGPRDGATVVQAYVAPPASSVVGRPAKELKGFAKVFVRAGQMLEDVEIRIPRKYAASYWDERRGAWCEEAGRYRVLFGESSLMGAEGLEGMFEVPDTRWWMGL